MKSAFDRLRSFLKGATGIALDEDKRYFAEARLTPIARRFAEDSVENLMLRLDDGRDAAVARCVIEAMTTHETLFFRDCRPFELFSTVVLPQLLKARSRERAIRIWCAACSTGQEPYSLAMLLDEQARSLAGWRIEILATDISAAALAQARLAAYNQFEIQRGLPVNLMLRYFSRHDDEWRLAEHMRARVEFRQLNLVSDFRGLGRFDVVFCRNVLLYFDADVRADVLTRIAGVCRDDAVMVLGAAESVNSSDGTWRMHDAHSGLNVRRVHDTHLRLAASA